MVSSNVSRLPLCPDETPTLDHLEPAASLVFRTPLQPYPIAADTKAGAILTAIGIMVTVVARHGPALARSSDVGAAFQYSAIALMAMFLAFSVASVIHAFRTISPRFPAAPPSLAFFGDIAGLSLEDYVVRVLSLSHEESLQHMMSYNHTLSRICVAKFSQLDVAARYFRMSAACWIAMMWMVGMRLFL